jgi:hypothetical protein
MNSTNSIYVVKQDKRLNPLKSEDLQYAIRCVVKNFEKSNGIPISASGIRWRASLLMGVGSCGYKRFCGLVMEQVNKLIEMKALKKTISSFDEDGRYSWVGGN